MLNQKIYVAGNKRHIDVTLIGQGLSKDSLQLAMMQKLDSVGLGGTILNIKQGFSIGDRSGSDDEKNFQQFYTLMQQEVNSRQNTIDSLKQVVKDYNSFGKESLSLAPEIKVLFPDVKDIALSRMIATSISGTGVDTVNMIFVNAPKGLNAKEREKMIEYVGVRLNEKHVHLTLNPSNFPWPSVDSGKRP